MKHHVAAAAVLLAACDKRGGDRVPGTQSKAGEIVVGYMSQDRCADRIKYVAHPDRNVAAVAKHYEKNTTCNFRPTSVAEEPACARIGTVGECFVETTSDAGPPLTFKIVGSPDGPKIDWRSTVGYNPMPLITFMATKPSAPATFRLVARISDYYNFDFAQAEKTHVSVRLQEWRSHDSLYGYVPKESAGGARALAALSDGKDHAALVRLQYLPGSRTASVALIDFLQDSWSECDEEFAR